jgi:hypothetical protein
VWALLEWIGIGLGFALEFKSRDLVEWRLGGSLVYDTPRSDTLVLKDMFLK